MPRDDEFEIDTSAFDRRAANQALGGRTSLAVPDGLPIFKPKRAANAAHTLDLVPFRVTEQHLRYIPGLHVATPGKWYFERTYFGHRQIGVNNDRYVCPAATFGKRCPMCEARAEFKKSSDKEDKEAAKALQYSQRQLWLVWDHDDQDRGVQLWDESNWNFGRHLFRYINTARKQDMDAYKMFYHPAKGFTLRISCAEVAIGDGKNYEYSPHAFYPRPQPLPDAIVNHGFDLDAFVQALDYPQLKAIYEGRGDTEDVTAAQNGHQEQPAEELPPPARPAAPAPVSRPAFARHTEPEPAPAPTGQPFATGDVVSYEWQGDVVEDKVFRVDTAKKMCLFKVEGEGKLRSMPWEECTLVEADSTFDLPVNGDGPEEAPAPPPPPAKPPARPAKGTKWDTDGDEPRSAPPAPAAGKPPTRPRK